MKFYLTVIILFLFIEFGFAQCIKPVATINRNTICVGESITFGTAVLPSITYEWTFWKKGSGNSMPGGTVTKTFDEPGNYTATVRATTGSCMDPSDPIPFTVGIPSIIKDPVFYPDQNTCVNQIVTLTCEARGVSYDWEVNGGEIIGPPNSHTVQVRWTNSGIKDVLLTLGSSCGAAYNTKYLFPITVQSNSQTLPEIAGSLSVCTNATYFYAMPSVETGTIKWEINNTPTSDVISGALRTSFSSAGVQTIKAIVTNTCGLNVTKTLAVNVTNAVAPTANAIVGNLDPCVNSATVYSVVPTAGLSYSWYQNFPTKYMEKLSSSSSTQSIIWQPRTGRIITPGLNANEERVSVIPKNAFCDGSMTSITVLPKSNPNAGVIQAANAPEYCISMGTGFPITRFEVSAESGVLERRDKIDQNPWTTWATYSSFNTDFITVQHASQLSGLQSVQEFEYRLKASRGTCEPAYSNVVVKQIHNVSKAGDIQASAGSVCGEGTVQLSLQNNIGTTIRWSEEIPNFSPSTNIAGSEDKTAISRVVKNFRGFVLEEYKYKVDVTNGICPTQSSLIKTIYAVVRAQPDGQAPPPLCSGTSTNLLLTSDPSYDLQTTYAWTPQNVQNVSGGSAGQGNKIQQVLTNTSGQANATIDYLVTPSVNGCEGIPTIFQFVVKPIAFVKITADTICSETYYSVRPLSVEGARFYWNFNSISGATRTGETNGYGVSALNDFLAATSNTLGKVMYSIQPMSDESDNYCFGPAADLTISVQSYPQLTFRPGDQAQEVCSLTPFSIVPTPNIIGSTISWTAATTSGTFQPYAQTGSGSVTTNLANMGTIKGIVTYRFTPTINGCTGYAYKSDITVKPLATVNANNKTICSGSPTNIPITSPVLGTTFTWIVKSTSGVSGASSGNGSTISQSLSATSTNPGAVTYTITPTPPSGGCAGPPVDVTVTVNPKPAITQSGTQLQKIVCSNTSVNFQPAANVSGTNFNWTSTLISGTVSGRTSSGSGNISDILVTTGSTTARVDYVVTPQFNECTGTSKTLQVSITPNLTASISGNSTICSGSAPTLTANPSGYTYLWSTGATTRSITAPVTDTYSVTVSSSNYCSSTASKVIGSGTTPPAPTINIANNTLCYSGVTQSAFLVSSQADSYLWTGGFTSPYITVYSTGTYSVTITKSGCTATTSKFVPCGGVSPMVVMQTQKENTIAREAETLSYEGEMILIYPNPADDELIIELAAVSEMPTRFRLINPFGQPVVESAIPARQQKATVKTKDFSEGMFVLEVMYENQRIIRKVMIMH